MRLFTISELMRLSRNELCHLAGKITSQLAGFPEGSIDRFTALTNLMRIRFVLARYDLSP